ncbi:mannosyl-oligosaccharide glucosidase [Besnoitia besnoiti]|uniref:mannosyl-oligosaccharide glucosidase n=1 Tax=Besnoitia besnoiti TaxID=94643 RepID=A0A2A9MD32_BESBE|nr:mannosyl-oligosaccharide glucosidase [Besnoitia besnoiti]PFH36398.1 mannosyl-oligosaccharide glucosidase [Besnoitia besnoiti]
MGLQAVCGFLRSRVSRPPSFSVALAFLLAVCVSSRLCRPQRQDALSPCLQARAAPSPSPSTRSSASSSVLPSAFERGTVWGTYRPSAFFSLRASSRARGFLTGLAWSGDGAEGDGARQPRAFADEEDDTDDAELWGASAPSGPPTAARREEIFHLINETNLQDVRKCEAQKAAPADARACREGVRATWLEHDGVFYGKQEIVHLRRGRASGDAATGDLERLRIVSTFVKHPQFPDRVFSFRLAASRAPEGSQREGGQGGGGEGDSRGGLSPGSLFVYFTSEDEDFGVALHPASKRRGEKTRATGSNRMFVLGRGDGAAGDLLAVVETFWSKTGKARSVDWTGEGGSGTGATLPEAPARETEVYYGGALLQGAATEAWDSGRHIERLLERQESGGGRTRQGSGKSAAAGRRTLPNEEEAEANFLVLQVMDRQSAEAGDDDGELIVDVHVFTQGILGAAPDAGNHEPPLACNHACLASLSADELDARISPFLFGSPSKSSSRLRAHFDFLERLHSRLFSLQLSEAFPVAPASASTPPLALRRAMVANLLGSRGFFSGALPVAAPASAFSARAADELEEDELEASRADQAGENGGEKRGGDSREWRLDALSLFSFVPCRMKFPRPFLWDEGMHALVAIEWFPLLVAQNLVSWMSIMDRTKDISPGWLPRELALREEMTVGLPEVFRRQYPEAGNPPTLIFAVERLMELAAGPAGARGASAHPFFNLLWQDRLPSRGQVEAVAAAVFGARAAEGATKETPARAAGSRRLAPQLHALAGGTDAAAAAVSQLAARVVARIYPRLEQWLEYFVREHTTRVAEAPNAAALALSAAAAPSAHAGSSFAAALAALLEPTRYPRWQQLPASAPAAAFSSGLDDFPRPLQVYSKQRGEAGLPPAAHLDLHVWLMSLVRGTYAACAFLAEARVAEAATSAAECQKTYEPVLASLGVKLLGVDAPLSVSSRLLRSDSSCSSSSSSSSSERCNLKKARPPAESSVYFHPAGLFVDFATQQPLVRTRGDAAGSRLVPVPVWPWREDGRCGADFPISTGRPSLCSPLSAAPCCSPAGFCGAGPAHCDCPACMRTPPLRDQSFWRYEAVGPAPSAYVGVPSLLPLALGLLPRGGALPFFAGAPAAAQAASGARRARGAGDMLLRRLLEVADNEELGFSSPFGLRSLRRGDAMFHQGSDYWRGDVWVHINVLLLRGLKKHYLTPARKESRARAAAVADAEEDGESLEADLQAFYTRTRARLMKAVESEWARTGSFFERYCDTTGRGKGPFPFAGWTTTYLLLLADE